MMKNSQQKIISGTRELISALIFINGWAPAHQSGKKGLFYDSQGEIQISIISIGKLLVIHFNCMDNYDGLVKSRYGSTC